MRVSYSGLAALEASKSSSIRREPDVSWFPAGIHHVSNRTRGAAMGIVNNCAERPRLAAGRKQSQYSFRPVGQLDSGKPAVITSEGGRSKRSSFAEDFLLEHCASSLRVTLIGIAGSAASASPVSASKDTLQTVQACGFPS
jgi:hypothetical protein